MTPFNLKRYSRICTKVDASIFDSALSHTRRSDASEKREENSVSTFGRFRLWTSFESSPVSFKVKNKEKPSSKSILKISIYWMKLFLKSQKRSKPVEVF